MGALLAETFAESTLVILYLVGLFASPIAPFVALYLLLKALGWLDDDCGGT